MLVTPTLQVKFGAIKRTSMFLPKRRILVISMKKGVEKMSAKIKKLEELLKQLEADSEVDGCALVSDRGQLMVAALHQGVDEKAVSAMAAALVSIGGRVGTALESGEPKNIVIEGNSKTIIVRKLSNAALIATAPKDAKIGLIDFEMDKVVSSVEGVL